VVENLRQGRFVIVDPLLKMVSFSLGLPIPAETADRGDSESKEFLRYFTPTASTYNLHCSPANPCTLG